MSDFPECEQFKHHKKKICRCEANLPLNGPQSYNSYRISWGLSPVGDADLPRTMPTSVAGVTPPAIRGLGDLLANVISTVSFGLIQPCGGCNSRIEVLNAYFPNPRLMNRNIVETTAVRKDEHQMKWAYGVTTVKERLNNGLLATTIESLQKAGFDQPRLFIDGDNSGFERFGLEMTHRAQVIRPYGNWLLGLSELFLRDPFADRYAMFQDDLVTYAGLRTYLDSVPYPEKGYLNLYTFPHNQPDKLATRTVDGKQTHPGLDPHTVGFYPADQNGMGAVALVFNNHAVKFLLSRPHMYERVQNSLRGHKAIDGGVVEAMRQEGWTEYVHNPSLVQHTGDVSSMGNSQHLKAESFLGADFDATNLLTHMMV